MKKRKIIIISLIILIAISTFFIPVRQEIEDICVSYSDSEWISVGHFEEFNIYYNIYGKPIRKIPTGKSYTLE